MNYSKFITALAVIGLAFSTTLHAADKPDLLLSVSYFNANAQAQYLVAHTKCKLNGKFQPIPSIEISFYISSDSSSSNLLGKATTNNKGEAYLFIPPTAKKAWDASEKQTFVVVSKASNLYDLAKANTDIIKSKLKMDVSDDKKITLTFLSQKGPDWVATKGVDIKVGIRRLGSDLNIADAPTYTTDSTGTVTADYKRDSLAGDLKGNITLVAKVEDNDTYGNLILEKKVAWGKPTEYTSPFDKRTLFARRGRPPLWLEWMAYTTIAAVWAILLYLFFQLKMIIRIGKAAQVE